MFHFLRRQLMINSKGIKILCYITMGVVALISLVLVISSIGELIDGNSFSIIYLLLGFVLPLVVTVSLYPIFALANIEERVRSIDEKTNALLANELICSDTESENVDLSECSVDLKESVDLEVNTSFDAEFSPNSAKPVVTDYKSNETSEAELTEVFKSPKFAEAIDFINRKYGTDINPQDDFQLIKSKINNIESSTSSVEIFKSKVLKAVSNREIANIIIMHKAAYSPAKFF